MSTETFIRWLERNADVVGDGREFGSVRVRFKGMFATEYPTESFNSLDNAYFVKTLFDAVKRGWSPAKWAADELRILGISQPITVNVNLVNIEGDNNSVTLPSEGSSPKVAKAKRPRKPKAERKPYTLNFRRLLDNSLSFHERIVYSFAWKYHWINEQRLLESQEPKAATSWRYRTDTGLRPATITETLNSLRVKGYLATNGKPLVVEGDRRYSSYLPITLDPNSDDSVAFQIFRAYVEDAGATRYRSPNYYITCLGLPRRTAFRYLSRLYETI
jgi:hypothetical protein